MCKESYEENKMNRIVIADLRSTESNGTTMGHYFAVADNYIDLLGKSRTVPAGGPLYAKKYAEYVELPYNTTKQDHPLKRWAKVLINAKALFTKCKDDTVVLQCSAVAASYLGIFLFKKKNTKLYTIQYNLMGLDSRFKRALFSLIKKKIDGVICPEKKIGLAYSKNICVVPDYIYVGDKRQVPTDTYTKKIYDFSMVGMICKDKGIVEAAERLKGTRYSVAIAGYPQTQEIKERLEVIAKSCNNIKLELKYLTEEEYDQFIRSARYCILNYSGAYSEHSSGVVFDVIFKGTPVVGTDCKSLAFIKEYGLGYVYDTIENWNPDILFSGKKYEEYQKKISEYYLTHQKHQINLQRFIV